MFVEEAKEDQKSKVLKYGYLPVMIKGSSKSKAFSKINCDAIADPVDTEEEAISIIKEKMEIKEKYMGWQYLDEFTMSRDRLVNSNGNSVTITFRVIHVVLDWK